MCSWRKEYYPILNAKSVNALYTSAAPPASLTIQCAAKQYYVCRVCYSVSISQIQTPVQWKISHKMRYGFYLFFFFFSFPLNALWERFSVRCCHLLINALLWCSIAPKYTMLFIRSSCTRYSSAYKYGEILSILNERWYAMCGVFFLPFVNILSLIFNEIYWLVYGWRTARVRFQFGSFANFASKSWQFWSVQSWTRKKKNSKADRFDELNIYYRAPRNSTKITKNCQTKTHFICIGKRYMHWVLVCVYGWCVQSGK